MNGTVGDHLVRRPKTSPAEITVEEARAQFADDHVHMLLLTDAGRLAGTLVRSDLGPDAARGGKALSSSKLAGRTLPATMPADEAQQLLVSHGERRRAVVDDQGNLLGLLCLKQRMTGFCSDAEVAARAAGRWADRAPGLS